MDIDRDILLPPRPLEDMDEEFLKNFCKRTSTSFFRQYGLISHQINSYNDFINSGMQKVFDSIGEVIVEPVSDPSKKGDGWKYASVKFGKVTLEPPMFWNGDSFSSEGDKCLHFLPKHARLQNMTYSSRMKVNIQYQVYTKETGIDKKIRLEGEEDVLIGMFPIMVKSVKCWINGVENVDCDFDQGGYFIIKGAEKIFIAQEQICLNRLWVANSPSWMVKCRSIIKRERVFVKLVETTPFKSNEGGPQAITVFLMNLMDIPIWILFFALGVSSDKEVIDLIDADIKDENIVNILWASVREADKKCEDFRKRGNALKFVEKLILDSKYPPKESVSECIESYVFPNLCGFKSKACYLAYMVKCLLESYTGQRKVDNKDDFRNKRLELASELLERELRVHLKHLERRMIKTMQRDLNGDRQLRPIGYYVDAAIITGGLSRAFSTGAWSHPYKLMERTSGVVGTVRRTNPLQMIGDMRRTRQQFSFAGKAGAARYPHLSHWGRICYLCTPDGENCGLVKNLASTALVSTVVGEQLLGILQDSGMRKLVADTSMTLSAMHKIFVDGDWVGICEDSAQFVADLRNKRRTKKLPHQVEIKRDEKNREVRIFCDAGRILRPLLVVQNLWKIKNLKDGGRGSSFQDLLDNGVVELIGTEEDEDCYTAWEVKYLFLERKKYTHCELDLSFTLGLSTGIIPFANHDHAKRSLFQSQKHSQQAIGYSTTNPKTRVDTLSHQLFYPQMPLYRTLLSDCLEKPGSLIGQKGMLPSPEFYNGQCAIVAINVHLGYNQEDSFVMNRSSLERGMFRSEHIRSYNAVVDNKEAKKTRFEDLITFGKTPKSRIGRVDSLDDDGFPFVRANLQSGDIVIGKYAESGADHSIKLKPTESGMVQKVVLSANDEGKNFAVVCLRQVRSPCLGDKFSSMHGQKGVVDFLESQENFPFTSQGIVPDIVINPHAFPSRQTPGQLLEAALGKGIAMGGSLQKNATPFTSPSVDDIADQLHRAGFLRWGNERVYNGRTGEMIESLVFMGPTFYQRLIHMSEDKVKFRNTGPVNSLTRQPVADKKRFGGIKFGEMERDCLTAHGALANLHERLLTLSDASEMNVCQKCRNMATIIERSLVGRHKKILGPYCRVCESAEDIVKVEVPYGAKLLWQELFSVGICVKFDTELC